MLHTTSAWVDELNGDTTVKLQIATKYALNTNEKPWSVYAI